MPKLSELDRKSKMDHILDTAFLLFSRKGYHATSMNDIMTSANVSKGAIYVYFSSKKELLMGLIDRFDEKRHSQANEVNFEMLNGNELEIYIRRRLSNSLLEENRRWSRILMEFLTDPDRDEMLNLTMERRYKEYYQDLFILVGKGISTGIYKRNLNINSLIYILLSTFDGISLMSAVGGQMVTDEIIETTVDVFISYLKKR